MSSPLKYKITKPDFAATFICIIYRDLPAVLFFSLARCPQSDGHHLSTPILCAQPVWGCREILFFSLPRCPQSDGHHLSTHILCAQPVWRCREILFFQLTFPMKDFWQCLWMASKVSFYSSNCINWICILGLQDGSILKPYFGAIYIVLFRMAFKHFTDFSF